MLLNLFNVIYVLIAVAMLVLILLQRGAGAQAGSGFGSGASATVFGARGATTFLSRTTAVLAALFFLLSLLMGIYVHPVGPSESDLGVMSAAETAAAKTPAAPPAATNGDVPAATPAAAPMPDKPAPAAAPANKSDDGGHKADEPKKQ
ncbi:MAG: preprotein translocase subunit SecG [Rudaea sp.]|nr:preprotein translocase subunit SecG [Rudaea sp.]